MYWGAHKFAMVKKIGHYDIVANIHFFSLLTLHAERYDFGEVKKKKKKKKISMKLAKRTFYRVFHDYNLNNSTIHMLQL